ncbi:MAG: hypothetical protein HY343_04315 [Lentisphaerae bacterium]|nr:hypothetical protein [Lentisphaerota bacterium]
MKQSIKTVGWSLAIFVAFYLILYFSTERYRCVSMDILPHWSYFWSLKPVTVIALFIALVFCFVAVFASRKFRWGMPVSALVLLSLLLFYRHIIIQSRGSSACGSCANHMHHICSYFTQWAEFDKPSASTRLPNSTEFQDFLDMLATNGYPHLKDQNCAGYRLSTLKTGYAFVGGGLSLNTVIEKQPLLAFCDAACHPKPFDRLQHAMIGTGSTPDGGNTDELVALIKNAIRQAQSGEVPYSLEAVEVMKEQLRKRGR